MAILLNDNLKIAVAKPVDNRYGPYVDTATALSQIAVFQRYPGLTVGIRDSGDVVEYWFKDGVTDLVPKTSAASGGPALFVSSVKVSRVKVFHRTKATPIDEFIGYLGYLIRSAPSGPGYLLFLLRTVHHILQLNVSVIVVFRV